MKKILLYLFLFNVLLFSGYSSAQTNIIPVRGDLSGFPTWTDNAIAGTSYLQLVTPTSSTITPAMNFDNYSGETLVFKARTFGGTDQSKNTITVSISTDGGSTWAVVGTKIPSTNKFIDITSIASFDLSTYNGTSVKIKFETLGANKTIGAGIDDITITGTLASYTDVPMLSTVSISAITSVAAVSGGSISNNGGSDITDKGICWNTAVTPTISDNILSGGIGSENWSSTLTSLSPNTKYYVRAYATNGSGTGYGNEISFTTDNVSKPKARFASNFSETGFTANWDAVEGASGYKLDVASSKNFSGAAIIEEGFDNGTTAPTGWVFTNITGTYLSTSTGNYGKSAPSLKLQATNNAITTPEFADASSVSFWIKGNSTDETSSLLVEKYNGTDWSTFVNITDLPTTGTTEEYPLPAGIVRIKFTYTKSAGNLAIDDIRINGASNTLAAYDNLDVTATSQDVTGLEAGKDYYYRVRAYSPNSLSGNSKIIFVKAVNSHVQASGQPGDNRKIPVGNNSGVGEINFKRISAQGNININRFDDMPVDSSSIAGTHISNYRWIIEPDNNLGFDKDLGYSLRFEISQIPNSGIEELAEGDNSSIKLFKRSTPGEGAFTDKGYLTYHRNGTDGNVSDDYLECSDITDGFSEFVLGSASDPLPVELSSFSAYVTNSAVQLKWQTASELNNYGFDVEKSADAQKSWDKVGFVSGNGNSQSVKSYSFVDKNPVSGKISYRLKQIDNDGEYKYSSVTEVSVSTPNVFSLEQNYPNPFNPSTVISYQLPADSRVSLKVYDILGSEVATLVNEIQTVGSHTASFNASHLSSGIYIYRLTSNGISLSRKMQLIK